MLADKDRIFTNLYGMFDRSLAGARARGPDPDDGLAGVSRPQWGAKRRPADPADARAAIRAMRRAKARSR